MTTAHTKQRWWLTCAFMVVAASPACRTEKTPPSVNESPGPKAAPLPSASATPAVAPGDDSPLGVLGDDRRLEKAIATMRACAVDKDCVLVRVSCGAQAAVATAAKLEAEKAMLAICPTQGSGGWNPNVAPPEVACTARRCEIVY